MRQQLSGAGYVARDGWQRVTVPYVNGQLTMRIVLPAQRATSIDQLGPALAAATQRAPSDANAIVDLTLPRWDTATDLPLAPALQKLGAAGLFGARADLSGIASGLFVSAAVHRANITVDEKGTEAAAVTGIAVAAGAQAGEPVTLHVDRPFAWAIVHEPTGTPIFTGHVTDPTTASR
jgi:serpin B